jgi:hypothetical protein
MRPYADTNFFTRYYLEMAQAARFACRTAGFPKSLFKKDH